MTPEVVVNIGQRALELTLVLMLILLIPALIVGLMVSIFQAATQINEMTLSFIPKLLVTMMVLIFGGNYLLRLITDYTLRLYNSIPGYIG